MKTAFRTAWLFLRLIADVSRAVPGFLLERMDTFVKHERARDALGVVAGEAAFAYLYAARGDAHIALAIAQAGLEPEEAIHYRDQGFSPESIRHFAFALAGKAPS